MSTLELVVKILASTSALYMCFSPAPAMVRIYQHKATGHMPVLPLVSQWSYNHIWYVLLRPLLECCPLLTRPLVVLPLSLTFPLGCCTDASSRSSFHWWPRMPSAVS